MRKINSGFQGYIHSQLERAREREEKNRGIAEKDETLISARLRFLLQNTGRRSMILSSMERKFDPQEQTIVRALKAQRAFRRRRHPLSIFYAESEAAAVQTGDTAQFLHASCLMYTLPRDAHYVLRRRASKHKI